VGEMENAYNMVVVIGKGKRSLGIGRCTWKDIQRRIVENVTIIFSFQKQQKTSWLWINARWCSRSKWVCEQVCVVCSWRNPLVEELKKRKEVSASEKRGRCCSV